MTEAMSTPHGKSYQKSATEEWLRKKHTDPFTRKKLNIRDLKPNYDLREIVQ